MAGDQRNELDPLDDRIDNDAVDIAAEPVLTTAAEVESAGRSCMAILVLGVIIVLILGVWLMFHAIGAGQ